jgi:hypothetical protein
MDRNKPAGESGVGLVEILVTISILSIVMLALGSLMFQATRDLNHSGGVAYRSAAQQSALTWATALPWDSLHSTPGGPVGCITDTVGQLVYNRCATLQTVSGKVRRLTITVTPTGLLLPMPDTVVVDRNMPTQASPFN